MHPASQMPDRTLRQHLRLWQHVLRSLCCALLPWLFLASCEPNARPHATAASALVEACSQISDLRLVGLVVSCTLRSESFWVCAYMRRDRSSCSHLAFQTACDPCGRTRRQRRPARLLRRQRKAPYTPTAALTAALGVRSADGSRRRSQRPRLALGALLRRPVHLKHRALLVQAGRRS